MITAAKIASRNINTPFAAFARPQRRLSNVCFTQPRAKASSAARSRRYVTPLRYMRGDVATYRKVTRRQLRCAAARSAAVAAIYAAGDNTLSGRLFC